MANETDEGKEFIQGILSHGQSFNEPPIFNNSEYPASAIAAFIQMLKENFEAHFNIKKLLANQYLKYF